MMPVKSSVVVGTPVGVSVRVAAAGVGVAEGGEGLGGLVRVGAATDLGVGGAVGGEAVAPPELAGAAGDGWQAPSRSRTIRRLERRWYMRRVRYSAGMVSGQRV
jgi:hypothetical protein